MGSNNPKGNHYIAQMLLRNFADDSQCLQILNKEKINPYKSKPGKAFVYNKRYVRYRGWRRRRRRRTLLSTRGAGRLPRWSPATPGISTPTRPRPICRPAGQIT